MNKQAIKDNEFKQTRVGKIPLDWDLMKMEEVALKVTDGTHDTPKPTKSGVPYITAIHVKEGYINFEECYYVSKDVHKKIYSRCNPEKNDLLIVNIGAGTATPARVKVDYEFSMKNVALIKPDPSKLDGRYLEAYQIFVKDRLFKRLTSGGAQPFLSLKEIKKLDIVLPKLPEQRKISSILQTWDKAIELKEKLIEQKKVQKTGLMQRLLSGEVRLPGFTQRWEEIKLADLGEFKTSSVDKKLVENQEEVSLINYMDVYRNNYIDEEIDFMKVTASDKQIETFGVEQGDVLFTPSSETPDDIGHSAVVKGKFQRTLYSYHLVRLRFKKEMDLDFKAYVFNTSNLLREFARRATGVTRYTLSLSDFKDSIVKVPTDIKEQKAIGNILSESDKVINLMEKELEVMKEQKKGLMQLLLTGKVRVKV